MKKLAITTALVSSVLILGAWTPKEARSPQTALRIEAQPQELTVEAPRVEEDDPAWDCATMGNLSCDPVPAPEAAPAVEPTPEPTPATVPYAEIPAPTEWLRCVDNFGETFDTDTGSLPEDEWDRCVTVTE